MAAKRNGKNEGNGNGRQRAIATSKTAFLAAFSACGSIAHACRTVKIDRKRHYEWLKKDPDYPHLFSEAQTEAVEFLEAEAHRRAVDGLKRFKFYKGEPILDPETEKPYYELEYSDTLLIFLLKGNAPEKYGQAITHTTQTNIVNVQDGTVQVSPAQRESIKRVMRLVHERLPPIDNN